MYRKTQLDNGIRIVTDSIPYVSTISIGFWVEVGSRDEDPGREGYSHFLEHMLFKGTKRRSALELAREVDSVGAYINAATECESTCFYINAISERLSLAIDILADMMNNSLFDAVEIEREKQVVQEELNMHNDSPEEIVHDNLSQLVWPDASLGKPVLGNADSVSKITRDSIVEFYHQFYTPDRLIITVSGNVEHDQLVKMIENITFFPDAKKIEHNRTCPGYGRTNIAAEKELAQGHFCLGMPGISRTDNRYVLDFA